jgi:small subunit ribosomal protein S6
MQQYELLCVLPGTLTEEEVKPILDDVHAVITGKGGKVLSVDDMGKSRLAYPMNHIRYGYFRLCRFEADEANVTEIQQKLRLQKQLLRAFITKQDGKAGSLRVIHFATPSAVFAHDRDMAPAMPAPREMVAAPELIVPASVVNEQTKSEDKPVDLEDIDKKLDEILERDITTGL